MQSRFHPSTPLGRLIVCREETSLHTASYFSHVLFGLSFNFASIQARTEETHRLSQASKTSGQPSAGVAHPHKDTLPVALLKEDQETHQTYASHPPRPLLL